ncbi:DEAD/DEAH box helicase [Shewanella gelidii]|uniref:RNA helicase n=1 Tax=Shewanella gelidii TaxID=1642821 RepID=A0A917JKH5_9GAMM|nr:DEAD/DEAH box helicase [Shewanella gelidii]MCL1097220.1 DEAD/DEAH box helicase [Shewanella gelidii]GGI73405.1 RNA helicase [Shewanella gelidii]
MKFETLDLALPLQQAVAACGYTQLTKVQQAVIPHALANKDLMACAETGTGKTAAFSLPILQRLFEQNYSAEQGSVLRALVMTPTRELAIQVAENIGRYSEFLPVKTVAVYGGANINPQRKAVQQGVDILVATPGRLFDLIGQHGLNLETVTHLVIDEADRMLDLGFVKDIERVKSLVATQHQTQLYSATYHDNVRKLANKMLLAPEWINVTTQTTAEKISQSVYLVDQRRKAEMLSELVGRHNWQQVLVFVSTKESAEFLLKELKLDGIKAAVFHGDKTQGARNKALEDFKSGAIRVMVATDVAARGLDIQALPLVINFELPDAAEDYVHRIGRTGRAGLAGQAISFVSPSDVVQLSEIEGLIEKKLPQKVVAGYEAGAPLPARYRAQPEPLKPKKKVARDGKLRSSKNKRSSASQSKPHGRDSAAQKPKRNSPKWAKK